MSKFHLKTGDTVVVIAGKDKGKKGGRRIVEYGVNEFIKIEKRQHRREEKIKDVERVDNRRPPPKLFF